MSTRAETTRACLRAAALHVIEEAGLSAASARTIATEAGVNQALIFYHFGTVSELIEAASNEAVDARIAHYREAFEAVTDLPALLAIGREVQQVEHEHGTMKVMAQLMAGAQSDPVLARATSRAIAAWTGEVEHVLRRILDTGSLGRLFDSAGMAQLIIATTVGIELVHGTDPGATAKAFATIEQLNDLVQRLNEPGPVARRAIRIAFRSNRT